ncbi:hypothetical protein L3X38_041226 [Prunus dulcis]|uniref:Uncharacterized protein n=1 Tax=Prunus dulcis TaxID=3755 RepID=A0AAD4YKQ4_PRUDU|nr:hypothetical protein L3X38_041226 [Prunus dulcis]
MTLAPSQVSPPLLIRFSLVTVPPFPLLILVMSNFPLGQSEIKDFINQLRNSRHHNQALEVSEWMSDVMKHDLSPGDIAVRLDLISKVRGLQQAESYFDSIC